MQSNQWLNRVRRARKLFAGVGAALLMGCVQAAADEAFVTDQTGDEVSVLDLATKRVVGRIPVAGKPAGIAMARDGRTAFVTSTEGKYVSVIDTSSRKIVARIMMPDTPLGVAVDPAGGFIYVAGFYQPRLYKIDVAARAIVATVTVGASPSGVAVTPDGALIVTADRDDDQISIIDAAAFTVQGAVKVGAHPFGVTIDLPASAPTPPMSKAMTFRWSTCKRESSSERWRSASGPTRSPWRKGEASPATNMMEPFRSSISRRCGLCSGFRLGTIPRGSKPAPMAPASTSSTGSPTKSGRSMRKRSK